MKLQKLLLRWDPPGLGLQHALDDGSEGVCHKDLPSKEEIECPEHVAALAEQLIDSEPELLARKRNALTAQLGRLYGVEMPPSPSRNSSKESAVPLVEMVEEMPERSRVASFVFRPSCGGMMLPLKVA
eukprot:gb/GFBE01029673.1/.p1 GENE.gb/GFBE01029673.1/~~gb/GFBE01029673.1/.p1  ORF type:complete len:128 (+),score=29.65 gb/GFBE01029673.1/:1-384(+)